MKGLVTRSGFRRFLKIEAEDVQIDRNKAEQDTRDDATRKPAEAITKAAGKRIQDGTATNAERE